MIEAWLFWSLSIPLIVASAGVVVSKNPVNAAVSLIAAFLSLAGVYILLTAHLVAFLQVIVYAGAVMVLFLFVIMLLATDDDSFGRARMKIMQIGGVAGAVGLMAVVIRALRELGPPGARPIAADFGTVRAVGRLLFTQYLLPFEITSVLLLVAMVGAVVVAKQRI